MERSGVAQVKVFNLSLLALCDTPTERQLDNMLYTEMQFLIPVHHDQCSGLQTTKTWKKVQHRLFWLYSSTVLNPAAACCANSLPFVEIPLHQ